MFVTIDTYIKVKNMNNNQITTPNDFQMSGGRFNPSFNPNDDDISDDVVKPYNKNNTKEKPSSV